MSCSNGKKILQLEPSSHYGGDPMIDSPNGFSVDSIPLLCYAKSPVIEALRSSDAAEHTEFSSIDKIIFHYNMTALLVPFTRGDVFSNTQLSLLEKRKLMKVLNHQISEQETMEESKSFMDYLTKYLGLTEKLALMVIMSICFYSRAPEGLSLKQGLLLCRRFGESAGVYSPSPLLYPAYGAREVSQAFSRVCAVKGGVQVLNVREVEIQSKAVAFAFDNKKFSASFDSILESSHQEELFISVEFSNDSAVEQSLEIYCDDPGQAPTFVLSLNSKSCCCPSGRSIVYSWSSRSLTSATKKTRTKRGVFN